MPKRGSCGSVLPSCRLSKQYPSINSPAAGYGTSRARRDAHCTLLGSPVCRDTPRLVLASRSPSRAVPTCDPHSARCSARCHTSRDFVPWRFLERRPVEPVEPPCCRRPKTSTIADLWASRILRVRPASLVWCKCQPRALRTLSARYPAKTSHHWKYSR